ncbi:hypothetical protein D3C71_1522370 [compost metagenome]
MQRKIARYGQAKAAQPGGEWSRAGRVETAHQTLGTEVADAWHLSQAAGIERQPIHHRGHQPCIHQAAPCAGTDLRQRQALLATEPREPSDELLLAALAGYPAAMSVIPVRCGWGNGGTFDGTMHHLFEAWDGQPGQADGHLVARADVERLPTCQRAQVHLGNLSVVQLDGLQT